MKFSEADTRYDRGADKARIQSKFTMYTADSRDY